LVERLLQLMEEGEFQTCMKLAEQQLLKGGLTLAELAKINLVICRSRLGLQDSYGAVPSGLLAVKLARDTSEWDVLGRAFLNVGTALVGIRQYDHALHNFYSYFEHLHNYNTARRFEGAIWKNIGIAHQRKLETDRAIDALQRARKWFAKQEIDHSAFTCIHDLINVHLQQQEAQPTTSLAPLEELLQAEKALARKHPEDSYYRATYLYDQAACYLRAGRYPRAIVAAMKAMEIRKGDHELAFHCHMVLHQCSRILGDAKQALGYALAARVQALQAHHYELEFLASQAMAAVIRQQGCKVVQELDAEYRSMGIDLSQYVSPSLLRRQVN
jgi:tetratricopeptide (TPR) repeat protein